MRKVTISFITVLLMIVAFSTVTYAWLTLSTSNSIEGIEIGAISDSKLEISLDGITYYEHLPGELIMEQMKNLNLTDVTSIDGKNFNHGIIKEAKEVIAGKDYLSLTFYFRTTALERDVYLADNVSNEVTYDLTKDGTYITSLGRKWRANYTFLYDENEYIHEGDIRTYYIKDAMRVAMHEQRFDSFDNRDDDALLSKIFDLTENEHRGYAKPYGAYDYLLKITGKPYKLPTEIPNTTYRLSQFDSTSPFALDEASKVLTLIETNDVNEDGLKYYKGRLTINVWIEGWDADLFDGVHGDKVKIQFTFKAVRGLKENK